MHICIFIIYAHMHNTYAYMHSPALSQRAPAHWMLANWKGTHNIQLKIVKSVWPEEKCQIDNEFERSLSLKWCYEPNKHDLFCM